MKTGRTICSTIELCSLVRDAGVLERIDHLDRHDGAQLFWIDHKRAKTNGFSRKTRLRKPTDLKSQWLVSSI